MEPAGDCRAVTEDELRAVVWDRCNRWLDSPEMREHLCPTTLFRPRKFFDYLATAIPAREAYLRETERPRLEVVR